MNPEVQKFLADNPGYTTEGPDANGITTYRAPNGDYINVRANGSLAMRGSAPPAEGATAQQVPSQPAAPPTSGSMDQAALQALIAQIAPGGDTSKLEFNQGSKKKTVRSALGDEEVVTPFVQWIDRSTGRTLEADVEPGGGSYTVTLNGTVPTNKTKAGGEADRPHEEPNPNDPTRMRRWNPKANGGQGGWEDAGPNQAEIDRRQKEADAKAERDRQTARQTRIDEQNAATQTTNTQIAQAREARAAEEAKRPDTKVEQRPINGQLYIVSTTTPKDGSAPTFRYFGPDGAQISRLPSEGEASVGGPKMPNFVLGASQDALTKYHEALWNDPSLTPQQREKRFQEAVQVANAVNQEWATQESRRQSDNNLRYNVATGKANFLQSGMKQALEFAGSLKGTDLGGKIFGAMLNYNLAVLQASGIDNLTPAPTIPQITPADMRSSAAIDAKRAQIDQSVQQQQAASATNEAARQAEMASAAAPAPATTASPKPAAAAPPAAAPTLAPPVTPPMGVNPDAGQALGPYGDSPPLNATPPVGVNPDAGQALGPTGDSGPLPQVHPGLGQPGDPVLPMPQSAPGFVVPAQPGTPAQGNVQMIPPVEDFAALRPFGQSTPAAPAPQPMGTETPTALRLAQIAATPSWLMGPEEYEFAKQNGQEGLFWKRPGEAA